MIVRGSSTNRKPTSLRIKILVLVLLICLIFGLEVLYRDYLFKLSINLIERMQNKSSDNFLKAMNYVTTVASKELLFFIIIIVYNFANIYKTFLLTMIICVSKFLTSFLKMIYSDPRPFYYGSNIIHPYACEAGYGNPSGHSLRSIAFYSTIFTFIINSRSMKKNRAFKIVFLIFFSLIVLSVMISRLFVGVHSLNQVIHGGLLGFLLYYFLFGFLELNANDSKQLLRLIEMKNIYYLLLNFAILTPSLLVYFFKNFDSEERRSWKNMIEMKCEKISENADFENEAFIEIAWFFANLGAFAAMKFEYYYTFGENIQNWRNYNFYQKSDDESLLSNLSLGEKDTQWNHTNTIKSLLRLVIIFILSLMIMIPFALIPDSANYIVQFIFKEFTPSFLIYMGLFYFFKVLLRLMKLVNFSVFVFTEQI